MNIRSMLIIEACKYTFKVFTEAIAMIVVIWLQYCVVSRADASTSKKHAPFTFKAEVEIQK
jgi:hypothetical protein